MKISYHKVIQYICDFGMYLKKKSNQTWLMYLALIKVVYRFGLCLAMFFAQRFIKFMIFKYDFNHTYKLYCMTIELN